MYHVPALLEETLEGLDIKPGGTYVDATFGGGGHSRAILSRLGADGRLLAFDQDEDVLPNVPDDPRFTFVRSNFKYLKNFLRYHGVEQVDGLLADLGVSSHHFDEAERGFSFRFDGELDMRMNQRGRLTAAEVLNRYDVGQLAAVFKEYGEVENARRLAYEDSLRNAYVATFPTAADAVALAERLGLDTMQTEGRRFVPDEKIVERVLAAKIKVD